MKNFQNQAKIIKVSMQLRALARMAVALSVLGLGLYVFGGITSLIYGRDARALFFAGAGTVGMTIAILISLNFFWFFTRLENGELFDAKTVIHLQRAGQSWLAWWILNFVVAVIENEWFGTKFDFGFSQLMASLTIIFVAWLLKEAQQLQEEQQLTV